MNFKLPMNFNSVLPFQLLVDMGNQPISCEG